MIENMPLTLGDNNGTCSDIAYQSATICVPVAISPYAKAGTIVTKCCGCPRIVPSATTCGGVKNGKCNFTFSQSISVAVPMSFGADATIGDTYVTCNGVATGDTCTACAENATQFCSCDALNEQGGD